MPQSPCQAFRGLRAVFLAAAAGRGAAAAEPGREQTTNKRAIRRGRPGRMAGTRPPAPKCRGGGAENAGMQCQHCCHATRSAMSSPADAQGAPAQSVIQVGRRAGECECEQSDAASATASRRLPDASGEARRRARRRPSNAGRAAAARRRGCAPRRATRRQGQQARTLAAPSPRRGRPRRQQRRRERAIGRKRQPLAAQKANVCRGAGRHPTPSHTMPEAGARRLECCCSAAPAGEGTASPRRSPASSARGWRPTVYGKSAAAAGPRLGRSACRRGSRAAAPASAAA